MELKEVNFDSLEYQGQQLIYAEYLSGKQLNRNELEILEATLWNMAI
jgi:hypothetical protein